MTQAHQSLTLDELYLMIREGADGVVNRAKRSQGIKPCATSGCPVVDSLRQSSEQHLSIAAALDAACEVAERAAHATITMQARKGRASYLGERSIGHQDRRRDLGAVYGSDAGRRRQRVRKSRW
ncbi:phosphoenolpyruvate-dihydroxyacetone phosphotransferase [Klebsiella pneumoniae]|uniref:Phosphoenolpyruvate-dihydroxyacetone phosphotransferase n=1 Tax=Klebsiella pneumoniae TaxID=573 RepID=A0A2X3HAV4_KLEPN|nr:phosphoenolpyruvate-dihydroxyacetone phosphotransferase [Klebsiella pneumoniae]